MTLPGLDLIQAGRRTRRPSDPVPPRLVWLAGEGRERLTPRRCRFCRSWLLTGWTDGTGSVFVQLDPDPVTAVGEVLAWLEPERRTWTLRRPHKKAIIEWRNRYRIIECPAGKGIEETSPYRKYDVMADHRCGNPLPAAESAHIKPDEKEECSEPPY